MKRNKFYFDMAIESLDGEKADDERLLSVKKLSDNVVKSCLTVRDEAQSKRLMRAKGQYVTLESKAQLLFYESVQKEVSREIKNVLRTMTTALIKGKPSVLVVGLGNKNVTADALGNMVVDNLIITRSLIETDYSRGKNLVNIAALAPSVFATTGIESLDIVKGIVDRINATLVIAVDTLATSKVSRLYSTFQITNSGLEPGSASGAGRQRLDLKNVGVPVIAVGVPLALYARSIAYDAVEKADRENRVSTARKYDIAAEVLGEENLKMILTPKDIDEGVRVCAKTIAEGINLCYLNCAAKSKITIM